MKILASAAIAAVLVAAAPQIASAQSDASSFKRDKHTSVRQRPRPDYEAAGVRLGAFIAYPRLTVDVERDDNIYAVAADETSDTIWRVKPEIALRSDWSRHSLSAFASSSINRYSDNGTEDNEEYTLGLNGKLDVVRGSFISGGLQYQKLTEPRSAPTSPVAALAPIQYELVTAALTGVKEFNRLRLTGDLSSKSYDYEDGRNAAGELDQDFRDRDQYRYGVKADYAVSPDTAFYVSLTGDSRRYDTDSARDSDGYILSAGVDFELAQAVRGQIDAGYMKQTYDNFVTSTGRRVDDISGLSTKTKVEWFPTELTTVTFNATRNIDESVVANSQGFVSTTGSVAVDHELLRNVLLSGQANFGSDDYEGIDREDKRSGAKASVSYLMNRRVGVFLTYTYLKQKSEGANAARSFTDNKLAASLALQF
ncbi:outer membrane beta-barrel protein [Caulobacter sp. CCNWLY153]|jgi:hypothetical protein|uniref:Outer membrane beta-barrel protein n=1 Tax=Caulobacter radicis TaxID=2172650 RepID=A0A2T9IZZ8_9CAUL|nr:outer membrane beta-barrel protein [Caulobacter radicis]PVM73023.1 hypothetical protein DDF65_21990 [Caulobacter radicis]